MENLPKRRVPVPEPVRILAHLADGEMKERPKHISSPVSTLDFLSPVSMVSGFGPKRASALRESGIETVGDLLYHFPRRYIDRSRITPLASAGDHLDETCTVTGTIERARVERGRRSRLRALLTGEGGAIELVWFAGIPLYRSIITTGARLLVTGRVGRYGHFQMVHPLVERLREDDDGRSVHPLPCYPLSEPMREAGVGNRLLSKAVLWSLDRLDHAPRLLPERIEAKHGFPPLDKCLREIHLPTDLAALEPFRARLRYEELYTLALTLRWSRRKFALPGRVLRAGDLPERFRRTLPFSLTIDQERAVGALYADAASPRRMHRLLQGDVGSGKTIVAFFACLPALASGLQVAWLAPTEVLAMQSHRVIDGWLKSLGFGAALLTGGMAAAEKRAVQESLASGAVRFVVGTHALIMPSVKFKGIGMMVIDEQHKFGAAQRLALQEKDPAADFLLMSATPIPQSLAGTLYGDLDLVTIAKPPLGRQPVATHLVAEKKRADMERFVLDRLHGHHESVFWVAPRIERDDDSGEPLKDAESVFADLSKGIFKGIPAACLHGRLSTAEKAATMDAFAAGTIKLLVCTTVIEVGIDVPQATIMVIENAERFGLAQLHQLRGRVGRGGEKSYCFLLAQQSEEAEVAERLTFFCRNQDGFAIAEKDLTLRGPGEVAGSRQTGWDDLKMADIIRDAKLFREIQEELDSLEKGRRAQN
jgi:ATP-dependent DNA helicase RecG